MNDWRSFMELKISMSGKQESDKIISLIQIGLLSALENEILSIEDAEGYLFNPYTIDKLEMHGVSKEFIDVIREGRELEDVQSLIPERLLANIIRLKELALNNFLALQKSTLPTEKLVK